MDCFYAAVHMRDDPSLKGKPVVIGGSPAGPGRSRGGQLRGPSVWIPLGPAGGPSRPAMSGRGLHSAGFHRYRQSQNEYSNSSRIHPDIQPVSIDEAFLDVPTPGRVG